MGAEPDMDGARRAAARLIDDYCISHPAQICVRDIAYDRHILVREGGISGAEGRLLRQGDWGLVRVRANPDYPGRTRFAIAHELGHWERHVQLSQAWLCSSQDVHAYAGSAAEIEANVFAGELLIPTRFLKPRLHTGLSIQTVLRVATEFRTSLTAAAVRCVEEADEDAYLVFSQGGIVRWSRRGRRANRYVRRGFRLRSHSRALSCKASPEESPGMQPVEMDAWFDHRRGDSDVELLEESVYFQDLQIVMTLLSIA